MTYLVIGVLATWRISVMLVYDPLFKGLRDKLGVGMERENGMPINFWAWMLDCLWCCTLVVGCILSVPPAVIFVMGGAKWFSVWWPFALSGGAILLHYMCRIHLVLGGYHDG